MTRTFRVGDRVIATGNISELIEDSYIVGNAGKIVNLGSPLGSHPINVEVQLTHVNGHPHHRVGQHMLFAATELEHID